MSCEARDSWFMISRYFFLCNLSLSLSMKKEAAPFTWIYEKNDDSEKFRVIERRIHLKSAFTDPVTDDLLWVTKFSEQLFRERSVNSRSFAFLTSSKKCSRTFITEIKHCKGLVGCSFTKTELSHKGSSNYCLIAERLVLSDSFSLHF